jgi:hypothetical protein
MDPMTAALLLSFTVMLASVVYGLVTMGRAYDRLGHGGLAMDEGWDDDVDKMVREAWRSR